MFYDQFIKLCDEHSLTPAKVRKDLGISQSTMASWKSRRLTPKYETLQKLANYFGVSISDLLDGDTAGTISAAIDIAMNSMRSDLREKTQQVRKTITFADKPDPEFLYLDERLKDGSITSDELRRYKELLAQGTENAHKAVAAAMKKLQGYMDALNDEGQAKVYFHASEYAKELTEIPKYQRQPLQEPPAATSEGRDYHHN